LNKANARIDEFKGVKQPFDSGFKRVAASVGGFQPNTISEVREFAFAADLDVLIFPVCNTSVMNSDVKHIGKADVVCASASKILRREADKKHCSSWA